ncbi:MAG: LacI family DNA-binding transcriptional regulator [Treponema sp.]|uniref:LacI family DNA-binding transcriptional regulator n=1 Tax=Treponema sp. TaxID=166 RepID=UPI0025D9DEBA|nr:LacI family DNA-binding transcriptional regulator [Treponema sp.]MBQ9280741.1 LacI family DNA-binding transcriptional regulator [Treponema sp.]
MKAVSKQATIYDVARLAGVSSATVSRVLNEPDRVAVEKRERVQSAIKELNFVPKADAVAKARSSYKKIGVVAPFFTQPSFMERLRGVASVLSAEHYELVVYSIDTEENLANYVQMLVNTQRVDGLILLCVRVSDDVLDLLRGASFPVCFVENEYEDFDCVVVHNLKGGQKAAEFLSDAGCVRPGFIGEKSTLSYAVNATEERLQGFKFYFANNGIIIPENHIWLGDFLAGNLDEGINQFLSQKDLPDGVFCSSDVIAARFIRIALSRGISIPGKIKVIGFDNIDIADYIGLTSVNQNLEESGRMAARLVLERIRDRERGSVVMRVPISVIKRETTGK